MQLDGIGLQRGGHFQLSRIGIEEEAHGNARVGKLPHNVGCSLPLADNVETAFGRDLLSLFRHERHLIGLTSQAI